jgi:1,4-dihydroxy-2-naphthoyl-CoA hydrolase
MIWKHKYTKEELKAFQKDTLSEYLEINVLEIGNDYIKARMPIQPKTLQPFGILHGGASAALAESMGSIASSMCIDSSKEVPVGIEINANHLLQGKGSSVLAVTTPIKIGRRIHVWNTEIFDNKDQLICVSRLTVMIIKKNY